MHGQQNIKTVAASITQRDCCDTYSYDITVHLLIVIKNLKK